jgi:PTH1 family peptidyl-tRNA hydrolase
MKIVVGLGNPGRKYERTRHNAGFMAVDELARAAGIALSQEKCHALLGKGAMGTEKVVLAEPQTYMNDSGRSVAALLKDSYASVADLIVLHDELDLAAGVVRVKTGGGHGGHNGLRSIIEYLGTADFVRVRIGIGRPVPGMDTADYVLSPFLAEEREAAAAATANAAEAARVIVSQGVTKAMNQFNQK